MGKPLAGSPRSSGGSVSVQWIQLWTRWWRPSNAGEGQEQEAFAVRTLRLQEQQEGPWGPLPMGLFKVEKSLKVGGKGHWRGISQTRQLFHHDSPEGDDFKKVFFPSLSVFGDFYKVRFLKWDLWSNIFKVLSNVRFCTSTPQGGLTSDNILEEDGSKTKQNLHCPLCALDVRHQISQNKAISSALLPLTGFSQSHRHWSQFPLCSFPVSSQESPEWHTQLPDPTDCGGSGGLLGFGMACSTKHLTRHSRAAERQGGERGGGHHPPSLAL